MATLCQVFFKTIISLARIATWSYAHSLYVIACHEILFVVVNETDETPLQDSTFDFVIFIYLLLMLLLAILQTAQVQICKQTNAAAVHGKLSELRTDDI